MCGIVDVIRTNHNVVGFLTDDLKRLEHRGRDSSDIAMNTNDKIKHVHHVDRVQPMEDATRKKDMFRHIGIGCARWAAHGGVTKPNTRPHIFDGMIAAVHNSIIESFRAERERPQPLGRTFRS